jgi:hypothetical protein
MVATHFRMADSPTDYDPGEQLGTLMLKAINAGLDRLHANQRLLPMLITMVGRDYDVTVFQDMSIDEAYSAALRHLSGPARSVDACAFVFSATLQAEGWDHAIRVAAVEGSQRGAAYGFRLIGVPKDERAGSAALYDGHAPAMLTSNANESL